MAKKRRHSLPKRIAGVKVPKAVRRYADTPLGSALIAEAFVQLGREALASPRVRQATAEVRDTIARTGRAIARSLRSAADASPKEEPARDNRDMGYSAERQAQSGPAY